MKTKLRPTLKLDPKPLPAGYLRFGRGKRAIEKRTWFMLALWGLVCLALVLFHGRIVSAFELHKGTGPTIGGKPRVSMMPYTYDMVEGNVPDHIPWTAVGHNGTIGTALEVIWDYSAGDPFIAGATTVRLSSSSGADTTGVSVTTVDAAFALEVYSVTLNGQTPVTLAGVSPYRVLRIANNSDTDFAGDVYAAGIDASYAGGVPQEPSLVLGKIAIAWGRTQNGFFTVPANQTAYIVHWWGSTSTNKLTEMVLKIRPYGQAWKVYRGMHLNQGMFDHDFVFPVMVPEKSDIQIQSLVTVAGGDVTAGFALWYED